MYFPFKSTYKYWKIQNNSHAFCYSIFQELMKLVGVSEWLIQFSWFLNGIMFSLFSFTIVTYLLQYKFENHYAPDPSAAGVALLTTVPVSLVWICIMLYCVSNIAFCFTFSALFHSSKYYWNHDLQDIFK